VADKALPPKDLTSTLNLRQLRSIPEPKQNQSLLNSLSEQEREVVAALPKDAGILIILSGAGLSSRYLLDSNNVKIGRDLNNEICFDDITVSRSHALIEKVDGSYVIKDLGSLNGTYVNAVAVKNGVLKAGDEIQIGKYHLTLFVGEK
jgi:pSer/pThr/pTyr-binding forkhead associated (FHA) protein